MAGKVPPNDFCVGYAEIKQCIGDLCSLVFTLRQHLFISIFLIFFLSFVFLVPYPQNMEVPRLGVQSELQLPTYTRATAMPDPSCICDLHHSSQQCRILNPPSEARDRTHSLMGILMVPSQIR